MNNAALFRYFVGKLLNGDAADREVIGRNLESLDLSAEEQKLLREIIKLLCNQN